MAWPLSGDPPWGPLPRHPPETARNPEKVANYSDPKTPGLLLRITPGGARVWYYVYRMGGRESRKRWLKVGDFKDLPLNRAQALARAYAVQVDNGDDPAEVIKAKANEGKTVKDLAERFIAEYLPTLKPRTQGGYKDSIRVHILPKLGIIPVKLLDRDQITTWHRKIKGKRAANLALAVLSCMLTQAMIWKYRPEMINPCSYVKRNDEAPRTRDIRTDELAKIGQAVKDLEGEHTVWALAAVMVTALCWGRLTEVLSLRRDRDVFLDEGYAIIRDHKGDSKQGAKVMELVPHVVEILKSLPEVKDNPYYFCTTRGTTGHLTRHSLRPTWVAVRDRAGVRDLHVHDFRSLAASEGEEQGVPPKTMAKLLGHSDPRTTMKHYAKVRQRSASKTAKEIADPIAAALGV